MDRKFVITLGVIVAGFIGLIVYSQASRPALPASNGSNNVYGKLDSKVTLTEFIDFQCEACYAYYPTVKQIKEEYKDRVKFQFKYFPIANSHQFARMAASYVEAAAQQGKFIEMHDKVLEGQKIWEQARDPSTYFETYAKEIGLDMKKLNADRVSPKTSATINADLAEVNRLGGNGTPTFLLNGKKINNPDNSVDAFRKVLDDALKKANN